MRIAILSPVAWRTPPLHYGPWEQIASSIAEGLVARGIDVTLFATLDSLTTAKLDGVCPVGYEGQAGVDGRISEALHVAHALARSADFDLIHNHLDWLPLAFARQWRAPMVTTIHGFSGRGTLPAYTNARNSAFVSISDSDRAPELEYVATVHHGIDLDMLPLSTVAGDSLVAFGRIHPDKGTAQAIEIARRAGRRLVICGSCRTHAISARRSNPTSTAIAFAISVRSGPPSAPRSSAVQRCCFTPSRSTNPSDYRWSKRWHAVRQSSPTLAVRCARSWTKAGPVGWSTARLPQRNGSTQPRHLDRAAIRAVAERRFGVDRMVDEYLAIYRRSSAAQVRSDARARAAFRAGLQLLAPAHCNVHVARVSTWAQVRAEFAHMRDIGFRVVRFFLLTEDFLPAPDRVASDKLSQLVEVARIASEERIATIPTLITINMSGKMWWPAWIPSPRPSLFADPTLLRAQALLVESCARALAGDASIRAFDLSNEQDDAQPVPTRNAGWLWTALLTAAVRRGAPGVPVQVGAHLPSLRSTTHLRIDDLATVVDEDCMHAYPLYCDVSRGFSIRSWCLSAAL